METLRAREIQNLDGSQLAAGKFLRNDPVSPKQPGTAAHRQRLLLTAGVAAHRQCHYSQTVVTLLHPSLLPARGQQLTVVTAHTSLLLKSVNPLPIPAQLRIAELSWRLEFSTTNCLLVHPEALNHFSQFLRVLICCL